MYDPNTVQRLRLTSVVLLSNAMFTVTTLPVNVSNRTDPVESKSLEVGDS
jgi:hypothetical protein